MIHRGRLLFRLWEKPIATKSDLGLVEIMVEDSALDRIAESQRIIAEGVVRTHNLTVGAEAIKVLMMLGILYMLGQIAHVLGAF